MIVATRPEPTVLPPSRSDLVVFRNLFVTVFAVLWLILWAFYLLFILFLGEMLQIRITFSGKHYVYHAPFVRVRTTPFSSTWGYCSMVEPECKMILWKIQLKFPRFVRPPLISGRGGRTRWVFRSSLSQQSGVWEPLFRRIRATAIATRNIIPRCSWHEPPRHMYSWQSGNPVPVGMFA